MTSVVACQGIQSRSNVHAYSVGSTAWATLLASQRGHIVAIHDRSAYIEFESGLVCFGLASIGRSSLNLLLEAAAMPSAGRLSHWGLAVQQEVTITPCRADTNDFSHNLSCNHSLALEFVTLRLLVSNASVWFASNVDQSSVRSCPDIKASHVLAGSHGETVDFCAAAINRGLRLQRKKAGLADSLSTPGDPVASASLWSATSRGEITSFTMHKVFGELLEQILPKFHQQLGTAIADVRRGRAGQTGFATALPLLGAGIGLTPAGDDFLAGVLVMLRRLQFDVVADALWVELQSQLSARTHAISIAHLTEAAAGHCSERAEQLLFYITDNASPGDAEISSGRQHCVNSSQTDEQISFIHAYQLCEAMGHSSGWDLLAGFLFALDCVGNDSLEQTIHNVTG